MTARGDGAAAVRTGGCLCGAVRFVARDVPAVAGACHCAMCRRWTGSALIGVSVPEDRVDWQGDAAIGRIASSHWAERAFCTRCGSGLWFRVTLESAWAGSYEIPIGLFDAPDGFEMTSEIYIDHKPDSFAYAGDGRTVLTRADCVAKFAVLNGETGGGDDNSSGPRATAEGGSDDPI